jgi:hypothetical protein
MADELKSTTPKPFVFVLMPFATEFNDIYTYGIKGAAEDAGAYAERLDEQIFAENILERLYNQINKADVLVADMTGRNPNVFYEVGYAHALGKIVLLLTKNSDDIPFDLKHYPHIVYGGSIRHIRDELPKRLAWAIDESKKLGNANITEKISLEVNGIEIIERSLRDQISVEKILLSLEVTTLSVSIWNTGLSPIAGDLELYLITDDKFSKISNAAYITPPSVYRIYDERTAMFYLGKITSLYAGSFHQINLYYTQMIEGTFQYQMVINSAFRQYFFVRSCAESRS